MITTTGHTSLPRPSLYWGMPQWHLPDWQDWLYPKHLATNQRLAGYARVFNSVEVGSTFYADQSAERLAHWYEQVDETFRFSFKVPQRVTHQLDQTAVSLACERFSQFIQQLSPLVPKLGCSMLQFPASVGADHINTLDQLLRCWSLPSPLAVEVRHLSWFDKGENEQALLSLLQQHGVNKVIMDSRPIFAVSADRDSLREAQRKKPRVPAHASVSAQHPVVRLICHPEPQYNQRYLAQWANKLCQWLQAGLTPSVFVHSADNVHAPVLAQQLEAAVLDKLRAADPDTPYQSHIQLPAKVSQSSLF